jgi:anhydro-N-acetylmuramic acid kinase
MTQKIEGNFNIDRYRAKKEHHLVGIMSGTSLDGVDAVLTVIHTDDNGNVTDIRMEGHASIPYSNALKKVLLDLCSPLTAKIDDLVVAHFGLSEWYAAAVEKLIIESVGDSSGIDAICLHGQTVWHAPVPRSFPGPNGPVSVKGTLQIGSGPVLRERTGIPVIFDFRSRDMAAGGEGAPLAPYVDALLFGDRLRGRIVQNIGGIGNATVVPAGAMNRSDSNGFEGSRGTVGENVGIFAFDTGPGNMILDELVRRETNGAEQYDADGQRARKGKVDQDLVNMLMIDSYFSRKPPKSTGREVYGSSFVDFLLEKAGEKGLAYDDVIATATAFTAESIARSYRDFIYPSTKIADVVVGGGGALNGALMDMLRAKLPAGVALLSTADLGIPEFAREAIAFAVLGHEALMGRPGNLPAVTGASHEVVLGAITL